MVERRYRCDEHIVLILRPLHLFPAKPVYIRLQTCFRSIEISLNSIKLVFGKCFVNPII